MPSMYDFYRASIPGFVKDAVWAAWNSLDEDHPAPVKQVARDLGMDTAEVAFIVYPQEQFERWEDSQEPGLDKGTA